MHFRYCSLARSVKPQLSAAQSKTIMSIQRFTYKQNWRRGKILIGTSEVLVRNLTFSRHYHHGDHLQLTFPNTQVWSLRGPIRVDAYNSAMFIACDGNEIYRPLKNGVWQGPFGEITFQSKCRWSSLLCDRNGCLRRVAHWRSVSTGFEGILSAKDESLVPVLLSIIFATQCEFG